MLHRYIVVKKINPTYSCIWQIKNTWFYSQPSRYGYSTISVFMSVLFAWLCASVSSLVAGGILRMHGCSICPLLECRRHSIQGTQALKLRRFFPKLVLRERPSVVPSESWLEVWPVTVNFSPFGQGMHRAERPSCSIYINYSRFPLPVLFWGFQPKLCGSICRGYIMCG